MQGTGWINLLKRIPPELHDAVVLMTTTGTELVLQRMLVFERDFMIALGRSGGTTEQGKLLIIPYDQLTYLRLNSNLAETDIKDVLSSVGFKAVIPPPNAAATAPASGATAQQPDKTQAVIKPTAGQGNGEQVSQRADQTPKTKPAPTGGPPSKSILLARLRQRLTEDQPTQFRSRQ